MKRALILAAFAALLHHPSARAQGGTPNLYIELEPLIVTAPRLKIPPSLLIDGRINATLMDLLQNKANARPSPADLQDPSLILLNSLSSPAGFMLKTRYTELGFLLTEGLAGTSDLILREKIMGVARTGSNPQVRAAALMAVSYNRNPADRGMFQEANLTQDVTVRFGGVEAEANWGLSDAAPDIANVSRLDTSGVLRMYAAEKLYRLGDASGRDVMVRGLDDTDWVVRAMAARYLGQYGTATDYDKILFNLGNEQNIFVKSEMCGALLKLTAAKKAATR